MGLGAFPTWALWLGFTAFVILMLVIDLRIFHRRAHEVGMREAIAWTLVWIALSLGFNAAIWYGSPPHFGSSRALEFLTGYLIEKALSVDNLFVFLVIFSYFAVPKVLQHKVLFWGILGALVMRAIFILLGAVLIGTFHWMLYIFGGFLVYTGVKLLLHRGAEVHPERNIVLRIFRRLVPTISEYRGSRFFVNDSGRRVATLLLVVVITVEATDVVFALDSIPAIFGITDDPFIVYTSNIFAILGLRALFFVLAGMIEKFHYLKIGLALVLVFIGAKMLLPAATKVLPQTAMKYLPEHGEIPIGVSLGVVAALLGLSIAVSLLFPAAAPPSTSPSRDNESVPPH